MTVHICNIYGVSKCFILLSSLIIRTRFAITLCSYSRAKHEKGFGLFEFDIGKFVERREAFGIRLACLWFEKEWIFK